MVFELSYKEYCELYIELYWELPPILPDNQ